MSDVFKHITVSSDSDEDEIIYAGVRGDRDEAEPIVDAGASTGEPAGVYGGNAVSEAEGSDEEGECPVSDDALETAPTPVAPAPTPSPSSSPAVASAASHASEPPKGVSQKSGDEATEADDLDVGPMPLAQRIVIVAVVICLIGAIAYYLAFMR